MYFLTVIILFILMNFRNGEGVSIEYFVNELIADDTAGLKEIIRNISAVQYGLTIKDIGIGVDLFLTTRPWWRVGTEPYEWRNSNDSTYHLVLVCFGEEWRPLLNSIVESQYPKSCDDTLLHALISSGCDSFGNSFYNYVHSKATFPKAMMIPYVLATSPSFYDDIMCVNKTNRFECAFLPPTNCSLPTMLTERRNRTTPYFSSAGPHGVGIRKDEFYELVKKLSRDVPDSPKITTTTTNGLFTKGKHPTTKSSKKESFGTFFGYAFLYRLNYRFRSMVTEAVHDWKKTLAQPFPTDGDCVTAIVRRGHDRVVQTSDIYAWCEKHIRYPNGTCFNDATQRVEKNSKCVHYVDFGCNTGMPYQVVSLDHVINATAVISKSKNIFVRCDDADWLHSQIQSTTTNYNLFPSTPPANHRSTTAGGVSYMAAIQIASECSGMVGHWGSAVPTFFHNILCVRHHDKIGVCPPVYDFSGG